MKPREAIRSILEAAVTSAEADAKKLALLRRTTQGNKIAYVLYDTDSLKKGIESFASKEADGSFDSGFLRHVKDSDPLTSVVYGYLEVKPHAGDCWNAAEVKYSAARKGFGPLMYELAMSDFKNGIMADRNGPSEKARNVWKRYASRSDVEPRELDDKNKPKTTPKGDDCKLVPDFDGEEAYLNNAYVGAGDGNSKAELMGRHRSFAERVAELTSKRANLDSLVLWLGEDFFGLKYDE